MHVLEVIICYCSVLTVHYYYVMHFFGQWMTADWFSCLLWLLCCFLEAKEVEAEILSNLLCPSITSRLFFF